MSIEKQKFYETQKSLLPTDTKEVFWDAYKQRMDAIHNQEQGEEKNKVPKDSYENALEHAIENVELKSIVRAYIEKFNTSIKQKDIWNAEKYLLLLEQIWQKINIQPYLFHVYYHLWVLYIEEKKNIKAQKLFESALIVDNDTQLKDFTFMIHTYLGTIFVQQHKYDIAQQHFDISMAYMDETNIEPLAKFFLYNLSMPLLVLN